MTKQLIIQRNQGKEMVDEMLTQGLEVMDSDQYLPLELEIIFQMDLI